MKTRRFLAGFLLLIVAAIAYAQDSKRESVEELLELTGVEAMVEAQYSQLDQLIASMGEQLGVKESEREGFENFMSDMVRSMKSEMSWENMREPIIDIYMESYTEEEIQGVLDFYRSDVGQSLLRKTPEVTAKTVQLSREMLTDYIPTLQEQIEQYRNEVRARRATE